MKKTIKNSVKFFWLFALVVVLQACYPGGSIPISDLDTVATFYNTDDLVTAPASAAIYWMVAQEKNDDGDDIEYNGEADDQILNTTLDNLVEMYGESNVYIISTATFLAPVPSNPNVTVVNPNVDPVPPVDATFAPTIILRVQYVGIVYPGYPGYGSGWWGGWYPGYPGGCYYCGYPPTITYQKYEVGSVILDMYDIRKLPPSGPIPPNFDRSWVAVVRGLLSSDKAFNKQRVVSGINQAFEQSPYLK